jgi:hypothetical protein
MNLDMEHIRYGLMIAVRNVNLHGFPCDGYDNGLEVLWNKWGQTTFIF